MLLTVSILCSILCGCERDKCEGLPAQAQIDVVFEDIDTKSVAKTEVALELNGEKTFTLPFKGETAPGFVFEFKDHDRDPRTVAITAITFDGDDKELGRGSLPAETFSSDGCNFFKVTVTSTVTDAGGEGLAPDAGADADVPDGQFDLPLPDVAQPDAPAPDAPSPDAPSPDAPTPDAPAPDAPAPDAPAPDVSQPDATPADSIIPDASTNDGSSADVGGGG